MQGRRREQWDHGQRHRVRLWGSSVTKTLVLKQVRWVHLANAGACEGGGLKEGGSGQQGRWACSPSRRISLQAPAAHPAPGACCLLTHPLLVWMHPVLLQASQRTLHLSTQDQEALTSAAAADAAAAVGKEADEWADLGQGCSAAAAAVAVAAEEEEEEEKQPGCLGQNLVHQGSSPA